MRRVQRRGEHTVRALIDTREVMLRIGGDVWVMSTPEARDLADKLHDAIEDQVKP